MKCGKNAIKESKCSETPVFDVYGVFKSTDTNV